MTFLPIVLALCLCPFDVLPQDPTPGARSPATRGGRDLGFRVDGEALKRPVLVRFERSLADAEAISKATGRPLLVIMNMDDEPASDQFAARKYRDPDFARLTEAYVPVVASIHRHNARDHDDEGRRILCPRFGCITCGEHIAAELPIYERWFKDNPVAPRHMALAADGTVLFDRFLDGNINVVDQALAKHAPEGQKPETVERSIEERMASLRGIDRDAVEAAYLAADEPRRQQLLTLAATAPAPQFDLMRLGLHESDPVLREAAVVALTRRAEAEAVPLLVEAADRATDNGTRQQLVAALHRMGAKVPRARHMAQVFDGLAQAPPNLETAAFVVAAQGASFLDWYDLYQDLDTVERELDRYTRLRNAEPKDPTPHLALAWCSLRFIELRAAMGQDSSDMYEDILRHAGTALKLLSDRDGTSSRERISCHALLAIAEDQRGDAPAAANHASSALPGYLAQAGSHRAVQLLDILARNRVKSVYLAVQDDSAWSPLFVSEAHQAFQILAAHPGGTAEHAVAHVSFLNQMSMASEALAVVRRTIRRFPNSRELHDQLRDQVVFRHGPAGIHEAYESLGLGVYDRASWDWFHGYGMLVAAEIHKQRGDDSAALLAYRKSVELFDRSIEQQPANKDSADHFAALAWAGAGRIHLERDHHEQAIDALLLAAGRRPESMMGTDGLGRTPHLTITLLRRSLQAAGKGDALKQLEADLERLSPDLLQFARGR